MAQLRIVEAFDLLQRARACRDADQLTAAARRPRWRALSRSIWWLARVRPALLSRNSRVSRVLHRLADEEDVLQHLQATAARDDERRRGHWELAKYLLQPARFNSNARLRTALIAATESIHPVIKFHAAIALARVLFDRREYTESLAAAKIALSASPSHLRGMRSKANALIALGRIEEARQIYIRIVAAEPESTEAATKLRALESLPEEIEFSPRPAPAENRTRLLVGIGGGIGDMLHATPSIRNIAERTGSLVDVIVFADNPGAEFLVRNDRYVKGVFPVCPEVFDRRYETVFLTHSFGPLRFPFNAERIVASADWRSFRPGALPETVFNLEAARALLGIPFEEADASGYFVADLERRWPKETLVGVHAGSKTGRWLSKRWPHFPELAGRLTARGVRVAAFGTRDEYVPGTEDRTGGSIEEMCRSMLDCTHFVSNDSGAMHIASALHIPVLALFAPTDPLTHLPLRETTVAVVLKRRCAPCEVKNHRYFASGACRCAAGIGVESVERKVLDMLDLETQPGSGYSTAASISSAEGQA